jgi:UDP-hydrolysing UDP-N-acetyl-D-glucosamine 2-epimerase
MRTVAAVTVARSDYSILRPILRAIASEPGLRPQLITGGTHWSAAFGETVHDIQADGFEVAARVDAMPASDTPRDIARSIGEATTGFADVYARCRPDVVLLIGDRFETLAAASAALPFTIPIAHVHGGELSEGAFDEQIRHAITKLSHLHFVSAEPHARRVIQMGEEPWRVTVSGAPALDNLRLTTLMSRDELERRVGITLVPAPLLVTYHPATLVYERTAGQVDELTAALECVERPIVITAPNVDTSSAVVRDRLQRFAATRPGVVFVENLGTVAYWSLMAIAAAMAGNSSSGIIEAGSLGLPVVDIGSRQAGRERGPNVIDVENGRAEITGGLTRALDPAFRQGLNGMTNLYGDGRAALRIAERLAAVTLGRELIVKRFHRVPA